MPNEIWLMTYWADIASYRTWHIKPIVSRWT
jgi:hypothetical protein